MIRLNSNSYPNNFYGDDKRCRLCYERNWRRFRH